MKFRTVLVLLSLGLMLALPLSATAQTDNPPPAVDAAVISVAPDAPAATFVVNSTSDSPSGTCADGVCTLREAIIEANANGSSKDTINFNIPGAGPHVITLAAPLQAISQPAIIDGTTQPGASCNTLKIVLNGSGLASGVGLKLTANGSTVGGLVIQRFPSHGVEVNSSNNTLACNFIGTNSAGSADLGNGGIGVFLNNSGGNEIRNSLISGNDSYGIYAGGANAANNLIRDNFIGLSVSGATALSNGSTGIILEGAANTKIGSGGGNFISGNAGHGILINGNSSGTSVQRNIIGLSAPGTADLGNSGSGVVVNSTGVEIGGANPGEGNYIAGNNSSGLVLDKTTTVRRNIIGLNAAGTAKVPNNSYGIYVRSSNNQIGGPGAGNITAGNGQDGIFIESGENNKVQQNFIGTNSSLAAGLGNGMFGVHVLFGQNTSIGSGNTIAYNNADGVYLPNEASQGNRVTMNSIFGNGDLGIDLGNNGVTPNDGGDPDPGANGLQNFPGLSAAGSDGAQTRIVGTLNSKANQTYRIEFFRAGACDPSGYGEGRGYLGAATVTTNGSGNAAFNAIVPGGVTVGGSVTATATDGGGNTSEFSQCRNVVFENLPKRTLLPMLFR